ncbi:Protein disulfide-isomerase erp38 [Spathaspora sp. JA1]|nr:Protein disulfide-isomerase erp38 [Spathaspora sp. JA1]
MNIFLVCLLLFNLTIYGVNGSEVKDFIIEFDDSSIVPNLERSEFSLIYFYSDSCKYCVKFNPVFENLSVLFNNLTNSSTFQILKTNARKNKRLSELFKIQHYPTIKLLEYKTKQIFTYEGNRDLTTLLEYLEAKVNVQPNYDNYVSPIKSITNQAEFNEFVSKKNKKNKLVIFTGGYIREWKDYEYPAHFYQQLAQSPTFSKNNEFAIVDIEKLSDSEILSKYEVNTFPSMIYFNGKNNKFKTCHTSSHQSKAEVDDQKIELFITGQDDNPWISSIEELHELNLKHIEYQGHLFQRKGMNLRQSDFNLENLSEDEEYQQLLRQIEL